MSWKWHRQVLEVRCFDNQSTCSGRRAEDRGSVFVCPRSSVFYYEGFSSRTDGWKLVVRGRGLEAILRDEKPAGVLLENILHCLCQESLLFKRALRPGGDS